MLKIENTEVYGWEAAIRGMRNPKNSWDKSDSFYGCKLPTRNDEYDFYKCDGTYTFWYDCYGAAGVHFVGSNDLKLMKTLAKAGTDHGKFLRMINVTMDVTAPLYWWKEYDTYKVGTVANSCSTMHKIHAKEFTLDDFSCEHLIRYEEVHRDWLGDLEDLIDDLNFARKKFLETRDKKYWWQMIQLLPSSYNQKRTVQLNYAVLKTIYFARKDHKLDEWHTFCDWILSLPYFKEICVEEQYFAESKQKTLNEAMKGKEAAEGFYPVGEIEDEDLLPF